MGLELELALELGSGLGLACLSYLPRCHSKPSAAALSSHAIALRSSSDISLPYLVMVGRVRGEYKA
jgi:hypothetical protein